jgi:hypothetical protein
MRHAALLHGRSHDRYFSQAHEFFAKGAQARGEYAVIIGQEDLH